jgi:hypothetical protein
MYWNDPTLYGATLPYRDIAPPVFNPFTPSAFTPWQTIPRFVPPTFGYLPQPLMPMAYTPNFNPMLVDPRVINPILHTLPINPPFAPPFVPPFNPMFGQPYAGLPVYNWQRPFLGC